MRRRRGSGSRRVAQFAAIGQADGDVVGLVVGELVGGGEFAGGDDDGGGATATKSLTMVPVFAGESCGGDWLMTVPGVLLLLGLSISWKLKPNDVNACSASATGRFRTSGTVLLPLATTTFTAEPALTFAPAAGV